MTSPTPNLERNEARNEPDAVACPPAPAGSASKEMPSAIPYINLTSGLEWAPLVPNFRLVRIQSSHFEANAMWSSVMDLDYGFLIDAATVGVTLYDCGSRNGPATRAQWKGVPWLTFAYARAVGSEVNRDGWRYDWRREFEGFYCAGEPSVSPKAKAKLRYVARLTGSERLNIACMSMRSTMDGRVEQLSEYGLSMRRAA